MICRRAGFRCHRRFQCEAGLVFTFTLLALTLLTLRPVCGVEVAAALPLSGDETSIGSAALQGIQLAIEEANADGGKPHIELAIYDDRSNDDEAKKLASQIVASRATVVLGPALTTSSVAAGPTYAQAGMVALTPTAAGDAVTQNATTFRVVLKNSEQGQMIAIYLSRVIGGRRADVMVVDNPYGRSLEAGFERAADRLGIDAHYFSFKTPDESEQIAHQVAAETDQPSVILLMVDADAARILPNLRRLGVHGPFVGGSGLGDESFSSRMADLPEEHQQPGYFTEGMYCMSPIILDSANSDVLAFAGRFRARFGHDPFWFAAGGYDAARLAAAALRATSAGKSEAAEARTARADGGAEVRATRTAVLNYLISLNDPARGRSGPARPALVCRGARPTAGGPDGAIQPRSLRIFAAPDCSGDDTKPG
jgi:ABC-type branched-subunit amino acid transport system substrate-binding protein